MLITHSPISTQKNEKSNGKCESVRLFKYHQNEPIFMVGKLLVLLKGTESWVHTDTHTHTHTHKPKQNFPLLNFCLIILFTRQCTAVTADALKLE
jgi:hypothetical protein